MTNNEEENELNKFTTLMLLALFAVTCATANNLTIASAASTANLTVNIVAIGLAQPAAGAATLVAFNAIPANTLAGTNIATNTNTNPNMLDAGAATPAVSANNANTRNVHGIVRAVARNGTQAVKVNNNGATETATANSV